MSYTSNDIRDHLELTFVTIYLHSYQSIKSIVKKYIISLSLLLLMSCSMDEGEGGSATIQGKVFVEDYNSLGEIILAAYAPDWDVFIVYGDDISYSDKTTTHLDGTYRFNYLNEGEYTVYAYSKCEQCANNIEPVIIDTIIMDRNETLELPDLIVRD